MGYSRFWESITEFDMLLGGGGEDAISCTGLGLVWSDVCTLCLLCLLRYGVFRAISCHVIINVYFGFCNDTFCLKKSRDWSLQIFISGSILEISFEINYTILRCLKLQFFIVVCKKIVLFALLDFD